MLDLTEARTQFALKAAGIGVWEYDVETQSVLESETVEALLGCPRSALETLGSFLDVVDPDDRTTVYEAMKELVTVGTPLQREFRVKRPDGSVQWVEGKGQALRDADGQIARVLGVAIDVSHRKLLEAQLQQAQKMEAIGRLAGGVAHDFNNLLTAILGYGELLAARLGEHDPRRLDLMEITDAAERASALTRQLLTFSRKQVVVPTVLDLNQVVSGMLKMLGRVLDEHVTVRTQFAPALPAIKADAGQMEQIVLNLAINARDAMPRGGSLWIETGTVHVDGPMRCVTDDVQPGQYVSLVVRDNGSGMSAEVLGRIFEPFFTTKPAGKGTGLGLSTVYGIVKQAGGFICVESSLGAGTTFRVLLPFCDRCPVPAAKPVRASDLRPGSGTVLLVEDDESVRRLAQLTLAEAGYRVIAAAGPLHALEVLERHTGALDLVVTDIVMPEMSGADLLQWLRSRWPEIGVLFISGYTDDTIRDQGVTADLPLLLKPFTPAALTSRVRECFSG